jgi:hypothetical protein
MPNEQFKASVEIVPAIVTSAALPELVERGGGAARFAWEEFFFAPHAVPGILHLSLRGTLHRVSGDWSREAPGVQSSVKE